ncbi:unnamed protein product [Leptosia nina]|uniref:Uncharacterized protein n=1 Tax=Leptosia nina TaxID=320188 RepID=A0AAV1J8Y5_9NEOP
MAIKHADNFAAKYPVKSAPDKLKHLLSSDSRPEYLNGLRTQPRAAKLKERLKKCPRELSAERCARAPYLHLFLVYAVAALSVSL